MNTMEGYNQPKIAPLWIKFQKLTVNEEEDRISELPDCLLLEILSRLPSTRDAIIRTGTLSKRWKHLWAWVTTLTFKLTDHNLPWPKFVSFVDKTLTQCSQSKLKKFEVHTSLEIHVKSQLKNWIDYAISRKVEELSLILENMRDEFPLDQSFFINTYFTDLTLFGCIFNPSGEISWKSLRSLCISFGTLDEDLIENILSGSPLLETLELGDCGGYRRLDITSKSVKNFVLNNYYGFRALDIIIEIKAPNILSLTIKGRQSFRNILLVDMSSLVEANLNYEKGWYCNLRGDSTHKKAEEEMLKGLMQNLLHVKVLRIGVKCPQGLSRLKAKGFVIPPNIKFC